MTQNVLDVRGACMTYPGVKALDNVDFSLRPGEVRALLGKNGAGKSTLIKLISGVQQPDAGVISIDGVPTQMNNPADAFAVGIATVHQELSLVGYMSVAENIYLGRWPRHRPRFAGALNRKEMRAGAARLLEQLKVYLDVDAPVASLSIAHQQVVEIARALREEPRILILDEPTSCLPSQEVDVVVNLVRHLADMGVAIVYVSHRMTEIPRVADTVTVLRDGRVITTLPIQSADTAAVVKMMTGHEQSSPRKQLSRQSSTTTSVALEVRHLSTPHKLRDVSFTLHEGEIIGLAGLLGSGRTELLRAIYGVEADATGDVLLEGKKLRRRSPSRSIRSGVGFGPEDRKKDGLVLGMSVSNNLVLSAPEKIRTGPVISGRTERRLAQGQASRLRIKSPNLGVNTTYLSGGNQQKVVIGKSLVADARILLLDEPTRGVDIDAKEQIYAVMADLAGEGRSLLFASSEVDELFLVCDRIIVLNHGAAIADLRTPDTNPTEVLHMAMKGDLGD